MNKSFEYIVNHPGFKTLSNEKRRQVFSEYFAEFIQPEISNLSPEAQYYAVSKYNEAIQDYLLPINKEPSAIETIVTKFKSGAAKSIAGIEHAIGSILPDDLGGSYLKERSAEIMQRASAVDQTLQEGLKDIEYEKPGKYTFLETIGGTAESLGGITPTLIAGPKSLILMALSSAGQKKAELEQSGVKPFEAGLSGAIMGATTFLTEKIPVGKLFNMLKSPNLKTGLIEFFKSTATDIPGEQIENFVDIYITELNKDTNKTKTPTEVLEQTFSKTLASAPETFRTSVLTSATLGGLFGGIASVKNKIGETKNTQNTEAKVIEETQTTEENKLINDSPGFNAFVSIMHSLFSKSNLDNALQEYLDYCKKNNIEPDNDAIAIINETVQKKKIAEEFKNEFEETEKAVKEQPIGEAKDIQFVKNSDNISDYIEEIRNEKFRKELYNNFNPKRFIEDDKKLHFVVETYVKDKNFRETDIPVELPEIAKVIHKLHINYEITYKPGASGFIFFNKKSDSNILNASDIFISKFLPSFQVLYKDHPNYASYTWFHELVHTFDDALNIEAAKFNLYDAFMEVINPEFNKVGDLFQSVDLSKIENQFTDMMLKYYRDKNQIENKTERIAVLISLYTTAPATLKKEFRYLYDAVKQVEQYYLTKPNLDAIHQKAIKNLFLNINYLRYLSRDADKLNAMRYDDLINGFKKGEDIDKQIADEVKNSFYRASKVSPMIEFVSKFKKAFYDDRSYITDFVESKADALLKKFKNEIENSKSPEEKADIIAKYNYLKNYIISNKHILKNAVQKLDYIFNAPIKFVVERGSLVDKKLEELGIDKETYGAFVFIKSVLEDTNRWYRVGLDKLESIVYLKTPKEFFDENKLDPSSSKSKEKYMDYLKQAISKREETSSPIPQAPLGHTYDTALKLQLELNKRLTEKFGEEKANYILQEMENIAINDDKVWKAFVIPEIVGTIINQDTANNLLDINYYHPRRFLADIRKNIGSKAFHKIFGETGSLGAIANPYIKRGEYGIQLIRTAVKEKAKGEVLDLLINLGLAKEAELENFTTGSPVYSSLEYGLFKSEAKKYKEIYTNEISTVYNMKDGKLRAFYVSKDIADSLNIRPYNEHENALLFNVFNRMFKFLVTVAQPAWTIAATVKDIASVYMFTPKASISETSKEFFNIRSEVKKWIKGEKPSEEILDIIKEGLVRLTPAYSDTEEGDIELPYYEALKKYGIPIGAKNTQTHKSMAYVSGLAETLGIKQTIEMFKMKTSEIKAIKKVTELLKKYAVFMTEFAETNEIAIKAVAKKLMVKYGEIDQDKIEYVVRNYLGTPNPKKRGELYNYLEFATPFISMTMKGISAGLHVLADEWNSYDDKTKFIKDQFTENRVYYKMFKLAFLPALSMALIENYDGGEDEKEDKALTKLRNYYIKLPSWKKTTGICFPLYQDNSGEYYGIWIPTDPFTSIIRSLAYHSLKAQPYKALKDMVNQVSIGPVIKMTQNSYDIVRGIQPTDYSGKPILTINETIALRNFKDLQAFNKVAINTIESLGIGGFIPKHLTSGNKPSSDFEKIIKSFPLSALGRFLTTEEIGAYEYAFDVGNEIETKKALQRLKVERAVVKLYNSIDGKDIKLEPEEIIYINAYPRYAKDKLKMLFIKDLKDAGLKGALVQKSKQAKVAALMKLIDKQLLTIGGDNEE